MTNPFPSASAAVAADLRTPPNRQFITGDYTTDGQLLAVWGGQMGDQWLTRAYLTGPPASTCALYIGSGTPTQIISDVRTLVDSTDAGAADYGEWSASGGLYIPPGGLAVFCWTGGLTAAPAGIRHSGNFGTPTSATDATAALELT